MAFEVADSDGDGLSDSEEVASGSDPLGVEVEEPKAEQGCSATGSRGSWLWSFAFGLLFFRRKSSH